jgi:two-component system, cell cycle response regulator
MAKLILVIDDSRAERLKATALLEAQGFAVLTASDGEAGISTAQRAQPDLILCDTQMPNLDGFAVARCLKQERATQHIPLVALTALEMIGDRHAMIYQLFDASLPKPVEPAKLVHQIQFVLDRGARLPRPAPLPRPPSVPLHRQVWPTPPAQSGAARTAGSAPVAAGQPSSTPVVDEAAGHSPRILMIDDSGVNIDLFARCMEIEGYETIPCMKSEDAEDLARKYRPDLVVCDIMMPHRDGFAVLVAFKSHPELRKIPFAIITSSLWPERDREIVSRLGACKFIHRPIDPPLLTAEIAELLERNRRPMQ